MSAEQHALEWRHHTARSDGLGARAVPKGCEACKHRENEKRKQWRDIACRRRETVVGGGSRVRSGRAGAEYGAQAKYGRRAEPNEPDMKRCENWRAKAQRWLRRVASDRQTRHLLKHRRVGAGCSLRWPLLNRHDAMGEGELHKRRLGILRRPLCCVMSSESDGEKLQEGEVAADEEADVAQTAAGRRR